MWKLWQLILAIIVFGLVLYSGYWLTKHGSYFFFYEEMVQGTIREMVKTGALK